jgi:hypothetical protein
MKKLYIFLFFLTLLLKTPHLTAQNYYQYFDGGSTYNTLTVTIPTGTNSVWQIGPPQKLMFSLAASSPNVIITDTISSYPPNVSESFTVDAPPLSGMLTAVRWKQKLDMRMGKDGGIVEFSNNGAGGPWQNAHNNANVYQFYGFNPLNKDTLASGDFVFSGTDASWKDIWLCGLFSPNLKLRFTLKSDTGNIGQEGWMIDNLMIKSTYIHPVKEISEAGNLLVYPSVTNGDLNVEIKKIGKDDFIENIQLINPDGKLVENFGRNYTKVVLDMKKYATGLYYLKVTMRGEDYVQPVFYEKE